MWVSPVASSVLINEMFPRVILNICGHFNCLNGPQPNQPFNLIKYSSNLDI